MALVGDATARTPVNDTCPTRAREIVDELESKVGRSHPVPQTARAQDDYVLAVPGATEPPD
jgi:hypothetical protein